MGSIERKYNQEELILRYLNDMFASVLTLDAIKTVAFSNNFDINRSIAHLMTMTTNPSSHNYIVPNGSIPMIRQQTGNAFVNPPNPDSLQTAKGKKLQDIPKLIKNIRNGYKMLIIIRGLPGSGKSYLAKKLLAESLHPLPYQQYEHIFSADDFFLINGFYMYDPSKISDAHGFNHQRAYKAMSLGVSPVFIDNTNTQMWEMKPYAMMATDYGYMIEIIEPDTWWAFDLKELARRNAHGVTKTKIREMFERYQKNVRPQKLLNEYNLVYRFIQPPQLRLYPPLPKVVDPRPTAEVQSFIQQSTSMDRKESQNEAINLIEFTDEIAVKPQKNDDTKPQTKSVDDLLSMRDCDDFVGLKPERETNKIVPIDLISNAENAWGVNEKALESWDIVTPITLDGVASNFPSLVVIDEIPVKKVENATQTLSEDFNCLKNPPISSKINILKTHDRDINFGVPMGVQSIPKKITVNQSCQTEEIADVICCKTSLQSLINLFPNIPTAYLEDLLEKCQYNVPWAVDVLLESGNNELLEIKPESGIKPEPHPDNPAVPVETTDLDVQNSPKPKPTPEEVEELKKCLESKFDINQQYYSDHVLKVKQSKFGKQSPEPSTSAQTVDSSTDDFDWEWIDVDNDSTSDDEQMEINLGEHVISQLEERFGDSAHPKGFLPIVQIPMAFARQLYTLYIESVYQQLETQTEICNTLIKEDEDFAIKLQTQELERSTESETSFQQIVEDQAVASLNRKKAMESWKNLTANDLATRLTRQKLYELFPEVERDTLVEILHAHDNDYKKTVEVLVASVGRRNVDQATMEMPPISDVDVDEMRRAELDVKEAEDRKPATYYREEAQKHYEKRQEFHDKAKLFYQKRMTEIAGFYSELAKKETELYDRTNNMAATAFLQEHSSRLDNDTLDLHYLKAKEAPQALDVFLDKHIDILRQKTSKIVKKLFVITGRGKNNASGVSILRPIIMQRLRKRKITFTQINPGLVQIKICKNNAMTCDLDE